MMYKVRNKKTGRIGVFCPDEDNNGGAKVYAYPAKVSYEITGPKIAEYKTRKNFWQRWEIVK